MTKKTESRGLKILKLTAANIKTLVAIEIKADGKEVILTGKNESGKSSAIDSIFLAVKYKAATKSKDGKKNIEHPVRKGEDSAIIIVELDNMIITRKFIGDNSYLEVKNKDGMIFQSPQKILDDLIGAIAFDPLEFTGMPAVEQATVLRDLAGIDISELTDKRDTLYAQRTLAGRDLSNEQAHLKSLDLPDPEVGDEEVSAVKLTEELAEFNAMENRNESIDDNEDAARSNYELALESEAEGKRDLEDAELRLSNAKIKFDTLVSARKNDKISLDTAEKAKPEIWKGTSDIVNAVNQVEDINAQVRLKKEYQKVVATVDRFQKAHDKIERGLDKARDAITKAIESAKYPLKGLTVEDDQVYLDGIVFQDLSDGKKLVASTSIAMALNPDLRVIFARNASLLDKDNFKLLRDLAKENDYQLWIETVHTDEKSAVRFIDGKIDGQQVEIDLPNPAKSPAYED